MTGLRPVAELMYIDFILLAMDQIGNQAAKVRYMFGGKAKVPMVIRTTVGGGKGYAGQHSQSLEAVVTMFPGLKVVAPWSAYDAKGLLKSAIRDDNPVIFIEHQLLYTEKGAVPEDDYTVPLGKAAVVRPGEDVTIATYSRNVSLALEAAESLKGEGLDTEVIDLRTLVPLDLDTVLRSVRKTGRLVLVTQAPLTGSYPEHVAYVVQANAWEALKAPIAIVAAHEVPPPMAAPLEMENLPSAEKIAKAVMAAAGYGV
jgi:pyruvate/2-oxoglutarate/acetoin dehydrogenase E1 component